MKGKVPRIIGFHMHHKLKGDTVEKISAVDYLRMVQPLTYMKKVYGWDIDIVKEPFKELPYKNWIEVTNHYDLAYSSYNDNDVGYVSLAVFAKNNGMKIAMDMDDNVWEIDEFNPVYKALHKGTKSLYYLTCITGDVSYLTTTNHYLKDMMIRYSHNNQITVLPNYIDLDLYSIPSTVQKNPNKVKIIYFGSSTHLRDLSMPHFESALLRIAHDFPQVEVAMAGMYNPRVERELGKRFRYLGGYPNYLTYIEKIWKEDVCTADISLGPLEVTSFTKAKSDLKWLESSAAKLPFVCTNIRQYRKVIEQGETGFLCDTEKDFYQNIKALIESKELREKVGTQAYDQVKAHHTIQGNLHRYKAFFDKVLDIRE